VKKIPERLGLVLILILSVGSTLADSMWRLMSFLYDGFFTVLILLVVWGMTKGYRKENEDGTRKS
jgi:hypothetical protein